MSASEEPHAKVVVVDDNEMMRTLLGSILRSNRYQVVGEAKTGVGALELAERLRPDIICMDVVMPEMDGPTLLTELRKTHPDIKFIFVSGYPGDEF